MVLVFMFSASWRLTVVTFVMVPLVIVICKARAGAELGLSRGVQGQSRRPAEHRRREATAGASGPDVPSSLLPSIVRCQVYGAYYRRMSKRVQTELAEANSVAEEALSTMTTVRGAQCCAKRRADLPVLFSSPLATCLSSCPVSAGARARGRGVDTGGLRHQAAALLPPAVQVRARSTTPVPAAGAAAPILVISTGTCM